MASKKTRRWSKLDNAAKIFPSTSNKRDTKVFRFACELYEEIEPHILQSALDKTIKLFPLYTSILKKGLFWYYFEASDIHPVVKKENKSPCSPIYNGDRKSLLFRVTYYKKRINLEVYHALTDGTGALHFLRTMVFYYITKKYADDFKDNIPTIDYDASETQKLDDSFLKYYNKEKARKPLKGQKAYEVTGERFLYNNINVIEGRMSVKALLNKAHQYNCTLSVFLTSILMYSIHEQMTLNDESKPVVITIPVNLRKYFPSKSARNFFGIINVGYNFKTQSKKLEDIIIYVKSRFEEKLTQDNLYNRLNKLAALEQHITAKIIPIVLKNFTLRLANYFESQKITSSFSNVGKVNMPPKVASYIKLFDVFTSTKKVQACMCSYQDNFVISFTSPFISSDIQRCFFRMLTSMGLDVEITTSISNEEKEEI